MRKQCIQILLMLMSLAHACLGFAGNGASNSTTLTTPKTGIIPVNNGQGHLEITNNGPNIAYNVHAVLPHDWAARVTQNNSDCATIAYPGTCTLHFSATAPFLAQGGIQITGDNITTPPSVALAFSIEGYLVFALSSDSSSDPQVIDTVDLTSSAGVWGPSGTRVQAYSVTDGYKNTATIQATNGITPSVAVDCYHSNNGDAAIGNWYLPAICQMGLSKQGPGCNTGNATIDNLFQLGFLNLSDSYWSSTEMAFPDDQFTAWSESFEPLGKSSQGSDFKSTSLSVRCARAASY